MTRRTRLISLFAAATVAVAVAATPIQAKSQEQYVPFVTDFPQAAEQYVPFVSDFPRPEAAPAAADAEASGIDWTAPTIRHGVGATIAVLLAGAGLVLARRRHAGPNLTGS